MLTNMDKLTESGCNTEKSDRICRSRGGESCAFDGAMIVLQPIADAAHLVHGPIACCGNSWEGRGARSSRGDLLQMGFTTDMNELDIIYGSEKKLSAAISAVYEKVKPKAIFVYATCVSGLIGEDIETACRKSAAEVGIPVIPVNAPGFVGPKNLGNRIAGEVLLEHVIGTSGPPAGIITFPHPCPLPLGEGGRRSGEGDRGIYINLIGEYNIAGDLWLVEPVLKRAGFKLLSRMTGNATFEEITRADRAKLNVVVCSRALINVAKGMEQKYGIPYVEVSFFGKTEMAKALRLMGSGLPGSEGSGEGICERVEEVIAIEEQKLHEKLKPYEQLKDKKAVLYTGGVKSWSFISALMDLGIEIVAVGTKKSTLEDEEKMKGILGDNAPLIEDVTPKNLAKLFKQRKADILIAGGRNQYLAVKEGFPFVDVNQERHHAYAGYDGLVNLAEQISNSIQFYNRQSAFSNQVSAGSPQSKTIADGVKLKAESCLINPLKHSPALGAAMAFQGIHRAVPIIHGAQGCNFLGKVLLTKHFREPISMVSSKLFAEDVIMGSEEGLIKTVDTLAGKNCPEVIGIISTGLTEVKGDDILSASKTLADRHTTISVLPVSTPDYTGGMEQGYAAATEAVLSGIIPAGHTDRALLNILAGPHLTPADICEMQEVIGSFGLRAVIVPDMSALDGSRQGISPLAEGGTAVSDIRTMGQAAFTFAAGACMEGAAKILKDRFGIEYCVLDSLAGLRDTDSFLKMLAVISGREIPERYQRRRRMLVDALRDAHFFTAGKSVCMALDESHAIQTSRWIKETGASIKLAVLPHETAASCAIDAERTICGGLSEINEGFDLLMANSHAYETARRLRIPLFEMGFPVFRTLGYPQRVTTGYRGTAAMIHDMANLLAKGVHR